MHGHLSQSQHRPNVLLPLLTLWTIPWLPAHGSSCQLITVPMSHHTGFPTGSGCVTVSGDRIRCGINCHMRPLCRLMYLENCDGDGQCTCLLCDNISGVDFNIASFYFYLRAQAMVENTRVVDIPDGLVAGQPLEMKIKLAGPWTSIRFWSNIGDQAFMFKFRFDYRHIVSNSKINGAWGASYKPAMPFSFLEGQEIAVLYLVTTSGYKLYVDGVLYINFPLRVPLANIRSYEAYSTDGKARILLFRR